MFQVFPTSFSDALSVYERCRIGRPVKLNLLLITYYLLLPKQRKYKLGSDCERLCKQARHRLKFLSKGPPLLQKMCLSSNLFNLQVFQVFAWKLPTRFVSSAGVLKYWNLSLKQGMTDSFRMLIYKYHLFDDILHSILQHVYSMLHISIMEELQ